MIFSPLLLWDDVHSTRSLFALIQNHFVSFSLICVYFNLLLFILLNLTSFSFFSHFLPFLLTHIFFYLCSGPHETVWLGRVRGWNVARTEGPVHQLVLSFLHTCNTLVRPFFLTYSITTTSASISKYTSICNSSSVIHAYVQNSQVR
jgi:hypothetical protein